MTLVNPIAISIPATILEHRCILPKPIVDWLQEHAGVGIGYWYFEENKWEDDTFTLYLTDKETAILFKLTWCGG